jgi:rhomboid protease GluP
MAVGGNIDYAGHLGGALAGVVAGWLLLRAWPRDEAVPRGGRLAGLIVVAGLAALAFGGVQLASDFAATRAEIDLAGQLLPDARLGDSEALIADSEALIRKYPRDPRVYFFDALRRGRAEDSAGAIASLRRGLEEEEVLARVFPDGKLVLEMRALLAAMLTDAGERDEAAKVLAPSCAAVKADARFEHIRELCP